MALTPSTEDERARLQVVATMILVALGALLILGIGSLSRPPGALLVSTPAEPILNERVNEHGPVDIGFAQDMSFHHEQALTMAQMAVLKGSWRVRQLAQGIVMQQLKEIGYMQGWLMLWQAPAVSDSNEMAWMRQAYARASQRDPGYELFIDSCIKGQGMPGMATPEELEALERARSPEAFDKQFLALMVRHHQGAVVMARFTAEYARLELVKGFARAMAAEQQQEMAQMLKWLRA